MTMPGPGAQSHMPDPPPTVNTMRTVGIVWMVVGALAVIGGVIGTAFAVVLFGILAVLLGGALYAVQQVRAHLGRALGTHAVQQPAPAVLGAQRRADERAPAPRLRTGSRPGPGRRGPGGHRRREPLRGHRRDRRPTGPRLTGALTGYGPDDDAVDIEEHPVSTPTEADRTLLTVIARMTALPGKERELRSTLEGLVEPTLAEDGNVNYDLHVAKDDPATFFFYENWTGSAEFDAHLASDHLVAFANRLGELLVDGADGLVITHLQRIK